MAKKRQHPVIEGLFSLDGRMRRSEYWLISIGLGVVKGVIALVANVAGKADPDLARGLVEILFLWPTFAIMVKRGHDRNRSALYTVGVLALILVIGVGGVVAVAGGAPSAVTYAVPLLIAVFAIYILVDYGFMDGTKGRNRFGPSPKGARGPEDNDVDKVFA